MDRIKFASGSLANGAAEASASAANKLSDVASVSADQSSAAVGAAGDDLVEAPAGILEKVQLTLTTLRGAAFFVTCSVISVYLCLLVKPPNLRQV